MFEELKKIVKLCDKMRGGDDQNESVEIETPYFKDCRKLGMEKENIVNAERNLLAILKDYEESGKDTKNEDGDGK